MGVRKCSYVDRIFMSKGTAITFTSSQMTFSAISMINVKCLVSMALQDFMQLVPEIWMLFVFREV